MHIFLDTNILLDVYLARPGARDSRRAMVACFQSWNEGFVAVHTLSNAFYIINRLRSRGEAWSFIRGILTWASVAGVSIPEVHKTQRMGMNDFEDALQIAAAEACGADVIITRNVKDFAGKTSIPVMLPGDFVDQPPAANSLP